MIYCFKYFIPSTHSWFMHSETYWQCMTSWSYHLTRLELQTVHLHCHCSLLLPATTDMMHLADIRRWISHPHWFMHLLPVMLIIAVAYCWDHQRLLWILNSTNCHEHMEVRQRFETWPALDEHDWPHSVPDCYMTMYRLSSWHCSGLPVWIVCSFVVTAHHLATLLDPETVTSLLSHQSNCLHMWTKF